MKKLAPMTDAEEDAWLAANRPIGKLLHEHPSLGYSAVSRVSGKLIAVHFTGRYELPSDTAIKLWGEK